MMISADLIRFALLDYPNSGIDFDEKREPEVWAKVFAELEIAMQQRKNIYLDNTNLTQKQRYRPVVMARQAHYSIQMIWFNLPLAECLRRNSQRQRKVPEAVIAKQFVAMEYPERWEYHFHTVIDP